MFLYLKREASQRVLGRMEESADQSCLCSVQSTVVTDHWLLLLWLIEVKPGEQTVKKKLERLASVFFFVFTTNSR